MGSVGPMEVIIILVAGLLILGPKRLPEAARQVGKALNELRRVSSGFQAEMRDAFSTIDVPADPAPVRPQAPAPLPPPPATPADAEIHVTASDDGDEPQRAEGAAEEGGPMTPPPAL
jgi:sec-independent protein translocase protein TatB